MAAVLLMRIQSIIIRKMSGESTHPCFPPVLTSNHLPNVPLHPHCTSTTTVETLNKFRYRVWNPIEFENLPH